MSRNRLSICKIFSGSLYGETSGDSQRTEFDGAGPTYSGKTSSLRDLVLLDRTSGNGFMKEIKAVVRMSKIPVLREALLAVPGLQGMTLSKTIGCIAHPEHTRLHAVRNASAEYSAKIRIEIVALDEAANAIVDCIVSTAQTEHIDDGLVWVTEVDAATFIHNPISPQAGVPDSVPGNVASLPSGACNQ